MGKVTYENLRNKYEEWKTEALSIGGYFPIFTGFKDTGHLKKLSGNALRLYIYLGLLSNNKTGECWPSIKTISSYFDKSERTIYNWLQELEEAKLIERYQIVYNEVSHTFLRPYRHQPRQVVSKD